MTFKHRNPFLIPVFSVLTLGIYFIYWAVKTKTEIQSLGADMAHSILIIIPFANFYFWYKYAKGFNTFVLKNNCQTDNVLWFIFTAFCPIISSMVIQHKLNEFNKNNN